MFTGIIEEIGEVLSLHFDGKSGKITIKAKTVVSGTKIGESIAVNGACLTVVDVQKEKFTADVMAETFRSTNLQLLKIGDKVNLERAVGPESRFGGHIVSGHIDGTGIVTKTKIEGNATWIFVKTSSDILNLIISKGSVALDGVSLTVAFLSDEEFAVSVIPHTQIATTLLDKKIGDKLNIENDIIGKYVKKFVQCDRNSENASNEHDKKLQEWLESQ